MKSGKLLGESLSEYNFYDAEKNYIGSIIPLLKETKIVKKIPPKFVFLIFAKFTFWIMGLNLPFKLQKIFQNIFIKRFFRI